MKLKSLVLLTLAVCAHSLRASAAEKPHDPSTHTHEKKTAGPNGGRILNGPDPRAEFFVTADRKVQITFIGKDGKPVTPAGQVVIVTAGERAAPTKLAFTRTGNVLVSDGPLPAGNDVPTVVQIIPAPGASTVTNKFHVDLTKCDECKNAEYACICDH